MDPKTQDPAKARMNQRLRASNAYQVIMAVTAKRPKIVSGSTDEGPPWGERAATDGSDSLAQRP
jgi:hypothetical protein